MKIKPLSFIILALLFIAAGGDIALILTIGVGAYFTISNFSGEQPTFFVEFNAPALSYQPVQTDDRKWKSA